MCSSAGKQQISGRIHTLQGEQAGGSRGEDQPARVAGDSQLAIVKYMSISNIVREARRRSGLTQADLAQQAGVPKSTVGRIESGARVPSTDMVERLVRAAGLDVSVSLSEPDPGTDSMFERTLRRSPAERLADATRVARFVLRGRGEVASASDG